MENARGETTPLVIAEVAQAHDGSLGNAVAFIHAVAEAGAGAVKFQCHADDSNNEFPQDRPQTFGFPQDVDRQAYWQRTAFDERQWGQLACVAHDCGLQFGVTPFSATAAGIVWPYCDFMKVARYNWHLLPHLHCSTIIATVMAERRVPDGIEAIGLDRLLYRGISCHSGTVEQPLHAIRNGAAIVEVHVCWHRQQFGPDTPYSITINELAEVCNPCK